MQTDGWSRQAQAHEICKSVLFAQLQISFSNFVWHGVIWTIHSGVFSLVFSRIRLCRKQIKYITVLSTWTRNIASISAQPTTIKGAAKTFLLSFKVVICVARLWTQSSLDTGECNGSRTHFISITIRCSNQTEIVRPEIKHHLGTCLCQSSFQIWAPGRQLQLDSFSIWLDSFWLAWSLTVTCFVLDFTHFNSISVDDKAEPRRSK